MVLPLEEKGLGRTKGHWNTAVPEKSRSPTENRLAKPVEAEQSKEKTQAGRGRKSNGKSRLFMDSFYRSYVRHRRFSGFKGWLTWPGRFLWSPPLLAWFLLCRSYAAETEQGQTNTPAANSSAQGESSRAILEIKLQTTSKEIAQLEDELKQATAFKALVQSTIGKMDAGSTNFSQAWVSEVQQKFQFLKSTWKPELATECTSAAYDFVGSVRRLFYRTASDSEAVQEFRAALYPVNYMQSRAQSDFPAALVALVLTNLPYPQFQLQSLSAKYPNISRISEVIYGVRTNSPLPALHLPGGAAALPMAEAEVEVNDLPRLFKETSLENLAKQKAGLVNLDKETDKQITQLAKDLQTKRDVLMDFDAKMKSREDAQAGIQTRVSQNLQPIFWGIMLSIIMTLVILRYRCDAQSLLMIRERTAVEMLSIGMFLVTVLFLGAGGFIEKATLGTLLGTLAGYLFTRRASASGPDSPETSAPLPETPGKPFWTAANKTLSVPAFPKSAKYLTALCRPTGGGLELALGVSSGKDITCDLSKLPPGNYELWAVAVNETGLGQPSVSINTMLP